MQTSLRRLFLLSTACFIFALLNGCALTKAHISLTYVPQANLAKIDGADSVTVRLDVKDGRTIKDKVGVKKNGYGMEMAAIIAKEDVAITVKNAIEAELANRGFRLGGGEISIVSELSKFYNDFKIGFWSGTAVAEVIMNVQVKKADGSLVFSKLVTGEGRKEGLWVASGSNAKVALDSALRDAVDKLFSDAAFIDAMLKAAKS